MAKSLIGIRNSALALWLVAGCGSDGGDDNPAPGTDSGAPVDSGGTNDGGTLQDSGAPDSALADSGLADGGASDAGGGDSGTADAGTSDAGSAELAEALRTEGVSVTPRRAELLVAAVCKKLSGCDPANVNEADCVREGMSDWTDPSIYESAEDRPCTDATLDLIACLATTAACDQDAACMSFESTENAICGLDGGT